jgi:hypothetical protein
MTETGGVGVLEIEEPVVRHKAQASSGRVGGSGGGKVVAVKWWRRVRRRMG